jgi:ubiquinone biosynthesis protein COQ4
MSMTYLRSLPENTVGRTYADWLDREGVSPDTRDTVKYIDDEECAYVMQRYRESHDFYHALTGLPIFREGEVALKAFEFANTLLPMTGLSMFAVTTLKPAERKRFFEIYLPWALKNGLQGKEVINVYWEEQLERDVDELRNELGIQKPVDLRDIRRKDKARRKKKRRNVLAIVWVSIEKYAIQMANTKILLLQHPAYAIRFTSRAGRRRHRPNLSAD